MRCGVGHELRAQRLTHGGRMLHAACITSARLRRYVYVFYVSKFLEFADTLIMLWKGNVWAPLLPRSQPHLPGTTSAQDPTTTA